MSHASLGAQPDVNSTEVTSPQPCSEQGCTGLQSLRGRLGYCAVMPAHAKVGRGCAGSTAGSGLGREDLIKVLMHLVVTKPGGKVNANHNPYD